MLPDQYMAQQMNVHCINGVYVRNLCYACKYCTVRTRMPPGAQAPLSREHVSLIHASALYVSHQKLRIFFVCTIGEKPDIVARCA